MERWKYLNKSQKVKKKPRKILKTKTKSTPFQKYKLELYQFQW